MPRVIAVGSQNDPRVTVLDFTNPASPSATIISPNTGGGGCQVTINGTTLAVGGLFSAVIKLYDVTNPATPVLLGSITTPLSGGIGALAVRGSMLAAGENTNSYKARVTLIDIANPALPVVKGTAQTPLVSVVQSPTDTLAAIASCAFLNDTTVFVSGPASNLIYKTDFTTPTAPVVTPFNTLLGGATLDLDSTAGTLAIGDTTSGILKLFNASTLALIKSVATTVSGITSVAVNDKIVIVGGPNDTRVTVVDFSPATPTLAPIDPGLSGGYNVAIDGTTGIVSDLLGTKVALINITTPASPALLGVKGNATLSGLTSLAVSNFIPPSVALNMASLSFNAVKVGVTASLPLTITNNGSLKLNISGLVSNDSRFTFTPSATSFSLIGGASAMLTVNFRPTAETAYAGALTFATNDPAHPNVSIPVSGLGALPHIQAPATVSCGSVAVCLSATTNFTISNSGGVPLTISSITSASAEFSVTPSTAIIGPGGSAPFIVAFRPASQMNRSGALTINSDDPSLPSVIVTASGIGTATPPPSLTANLPALNFGSVPLQYFTGLRITVSNSSACANLIVTPSTSGAPFYITATDPTSLAPTAIALPPVTILPSQSAKFVVVFGPGAATTSNGMLTLTSNDPASPLVIPLTGTGVVDSPAALELILDRSGSMSGAAPGGTKMDALKAAVTLFTQLLIPGQGDNVGSVEFDDAVNVLTPISLFDTTQQTAIQTQSGGLTPRNLTSIGGGLQLGQSAVAGTTPARKILLVFTDGMENTAPMIAAAEPSILAAGTEVYAIGLGQPQNISSASLGTLAASAGGKFFQTDDTLVLRKNFVQVLADAFRNSMNSDPIFTLTGGQTKTIPVQITQCEERISFILIWENPASNISLAIQAPDGRMYFPTASASNQLVRFSQQPTHCFYQIALPSVDPGSGLVIGPAQLGTWNMKVTASFVAGSSERCSTSVIVESDLKIKTSYSAADTSTPMTIAAQLLHQGHIVTDAKVKINVIAPLKSLASVSTPAVVHAALNADHHPIAAGKKPLIPVKKKEYTMKFSDRERGYVLKLPKPLIDGIYQAEIVATGKSCGGVFERYAAFSIYVGKKPDRRRTAVTLFGGKFGTVAVIQIIPKDSTGKLLGVGQASLIRVALKGKGTLSSILDHFDGTYSVQVRWNPKILPPVVHLTIGNFSKDIKVKTIKKKSKE